MSQSDRSIDPGQAARSLPLSRAAAPLASLVYRSRAVKALSDYELYELVQAAQRRNAADSITGMLLYDDGKFYQWLEGPAENIGRLMRSINRDPRHADIEVLSDKPTATRQFGDWQLRLATRGARSINSLHNFVVPSATALAEIRAHPDHAPEVLAGFSDTPPVELPSNFPLNGPAGLILKDIIVTAVLPELVSRHAERAPRGAWPIDQRARALADLLIGPDTEAAVELLRTLQNSDGAITHLYETLIEPAARRLGDLWGADLCSELDVSLGLSQLQRAVRVLNEEVMQPTIPKGIYLPSILIVPEPGEVHMLSSVLDSDALANAGWDPLLEFPTTDEALQDMMAGDWFDALDLSLSAALRRESWLPRVTKTIALARHASRNPALVVIVGGRIFAEDQHASGQVGADARSRTAMNASRTIQDRLDKHR